MSRPHYPSYVDLDRFINVARLRSLNDFIIERLHHHRASGADSFFLNQHRLKQASAYQPGVREIWLSELAPGVPYDYLDLDKPAMWQPSRASLEFAPLMDFLASLPFAATGRMIIIYDFEGNAVPAHRDHTEHNVCNEFFWMRTNFDKPFYLLNPQISEKLYVKSHSAWFDTVGQYHGAEASEAMTFSIRVDGVFSDSFRQQIPYPAENRSSAPALWANMLSQASP
jgi:hypothetical protein